MYDDYEHDLKKDLEATSAELDEQRPTKKVRITEEEKGQSVKSQAFEKAVLLESASGEEEKNTSIEKQPVNTSSVDKLILKNTSLATAKKTRFVPRQCRNLFNASESITNAMKKTATASSSNNVPLAFKKRKAGESLREFPAEIRLKIFKYYFQAQHGKWNGRSPPLIRALRCDQVIYPEIMEAFYESDQEYHLNQRNGWSFCSMPDRVIESIRNLRIEIK